MTDRFNTLTVVLEEPIRDDDAEALISAIRCLRGVLDVGGDVATPAEYLALTRVRHDLGQQLIDILYPPPSDE